MVRDLFFFGEHDPDQAEIILIESKDFDKNTTVIFVGGLDTYLPLRHNDVVA
jgi:hypothetical protein